MCNMNQADVPQNNKDRLDTLDLAVDPTEGCLESIEAVVAEETAAEAAVGRAVAIVAAAAVAVEGEKFLELARHRRWPWESFPSLMGLDSVAFHLI